MKAFKTIIYNNCEVKADEEIENRDLLKIKAVSALMDQAELFIGLFGGLRIIFFPSFVIF